MDLCRPRDSWRLFLAECKFVTSVVGGGAGCEVLIRRLRHVSRPSYPVCADSFDLECASWCTAP